jgi:hypothetical protein
VRENKVLAADVKGTKTVHNKTINNDILFLTFILNPLIIKIICSEKKPPVSTQPTTAIS